MHKYLLPVFLSLAFFIAGVVTLSDYGINWDAPVHMMRGQAFAHFYLTGQQSYSLPDGISPMLIKPGEIASRYYYIPEERWQPIGQLPDRPLFPKLENRVSFYQSEIWNGEYWLKYDQPHLPLIDTLSAFSNRIFWGRLGILGDIESYQIVYVLISALGVFLVSLFAYELTSSYIASLVAGLSLALFPIFFAESHINMKDPEQAVFFLGAVWAFWHWVKDGPTSLKLRRVKWFGVFTAFIALALAVKWNIVFLPLILIPWLFTIRKTAEFKAWFKIGGLGRLGGLGGLGVIIFLILIWPAAWSNPLGKLVETTQYYLDIGTGINKLQPEGFIIFGFNFYPLISTLVQTPEIILALVIVGVVGVVRGRGGKLKTGYLLLAWLAVPILRITIPGMNSYTGMRQIMEMLPAMALLAGMGGSYIMGEIPRLASLARDDNLRLGIIRKSSIIIVITVITVILVLPIWQLHPNQNAYFNISANFLPVSIKTKLNNWTITYGSVYKQAVLWLNEHAQKDANLAHLAGSDYAISPLWLREDISISPYHFSGLDQKGEYIMALYNPLDPPVFAKRYPEKFLKPVHKIEADGVPLLFIYKNEPSFSLLNLDKEKELDKFIAQQRSDPSGDFWEIILDKEHKVTRMLVSNINRNCSEGRSINELIFFDTSDPASAFILNEKKVFADGTIEYDFPAETAKIIRIYPQNESSCFAKGKILSVNYLHN